jgi:uncharacterized membrane protein
MESGVRWRRALWSAVIFLAFIGVAAAVRRIIYLGLILANGYSPPAVAPGSRGAQFAALDEVFARHPVLTMIHIVPGLLFMALGPFQFSESIRARRPQWHRWNGRILVACGLVIGISALLMSFNMQSIGGVNQAASTILFALFFLFALNKAVWHISRREIILHRQWMIRAYTIGLAVATIRPIIGIFFASSPPKPGFTAPCRRRSRLPCPAASPQLQGSKRRGSERAPVQRVSKVAERATNPSWSSSLQPS